MRIQNIHRYDIYTERERQREIMFGFRKSKVIIDCWADSKH